MSIHGFLDQNGQVQKYDYNDLENKPTIPAEVLIDDTLTEEGQAADAKAVGDAIANVTIPIDSALSDSSTNPVQNRVIYDALQNSGLSQAAKNALLAIFQHVAYVDEYGQDYLDALEAALYTRSAYTITYNLTNCESSNSTTAIYEGFMYDAVITAFPGYTLTGATASITMGGATVTEYYNNGSISIPNVMGNLVITVSAISSVSSISAVFSPGTDTPIDISSSSIIEAYINNTTYKWVADSTTTSICIPVIVGKQYFLSWSETDENIVGNRFRWGFSDTNTPSGQVLTNYYISDPQTTQSAKTEIADKAYLVIQLQATYISDILSNGYLSITELGSIIYTNDSLDKLRQYLTVTATYSNSTTAIVTDYALSGTLSEGTQTITASYGGKSDTFLVACTVDGFLYHFEESIISSGTKDFGWTGAENYSIGYDGVGHAYCHSTDGGDQGSVNNTALTTSQTPDFSGDFTISGWSKSDNPGGLSMSLICSYKFNASGSTANVTNAISSVQNLASGWSADTSAVASVRYKGLRIQTLSNPDTILIALYAKDGKNRVGVKLTPPSGFSTQIWHHYALTRKSGVIRYFVDGALICSFTYNKDLYFSTQVTTAAVFSIDNPTSLASYAYSMYTDDLFVAEYCKWDSAFNPMQILY